MKMPPSSSYEAFLTNTPYICLTFHLYYLFAWNKAFHSIYVGKFARILWVEKLLNAVAYGFSQAGEGP